MKDPGKKYVDNLNNESLFAVPLLDHTHSLDLLLELENGIKECLSCGGTAWKTEGERESPLLIPELIELVHCGLVMPYNQRSW